VCSKFWDVSICLIGSIPKEKGKSTVFQSSVFQVLVCLRSLTESVPGVLGKSTIFHASVFPSSLVSLRASMAVFLRYKENPSYSPQCARSSGLSLCASLAVFLRYREKPTVFHSNVLQVFMCLSKPHWKYSWGTGKIHNFLRQCVPEFSCVYVCLTGSHS
jgi:hypothetical protein